jgi:hypothetical protein
VNLYATNYLNHCMCENYESFKFTVIYRMRQQ